MHPAACSFKGAAYIHTSAVISRGFHMPLKLSMRSDGTVDKWGDRGPLVPGPRGLQGPTHLVPKPDVKARWCVFLICRRHEMKHGARYWIQPLLPTFANLYKLLTIPDCRQTGMCYRGLFWPSILNADSTLFPHSMTPLRPGKQ